MILFLIAWCLFWCCWLPFRVAVVFGAAQTILTLVLEGACRLLGGRK